MSSTRTSYDLIVLSGDIGGTNANFALIGKKGGSFTLLFDRHYRTRSEPTLVAALDKFLAEAAHECPAFVPELCCISAAGPVIGRRIELTNAPWSIDGAEVESHFGFRTLLINDFTAISYGVLLLDPRDPEELLRLPHADGSLPEPKAGVRVIIGAGTGLGYGYVVKVHDRTEAFASEGGHVTLPVYDEVSRGLQSWLAERMDFVPGAEAAVSGIGISNIHEFFCSRMGSREGLNAEILRMDGGARPALISANAADDPVCAATMDMFVRLYARVAADAAATFLPSGGVFLAGGIAAKNAALFLEGQRFMETFEKSYRGHIRSILAATPVMIVKDYAISLYGAANAAAMNC